MTLQVSAQRWLRAPLSGLLMAGLMGLLMTGTASAQPAASNPRTLYVLHCAGCHALDASGVPDKGVPTMRGALGHFLQLPEGRAFLVQVPGVNNAGLNDEQIALLTNWTIRQFSADTAPAGWPPYTAAEVAQARSQRPADVMRVRAELVQRLQREGHALK